MAWAFNPFTGALDYYATSVTYFKGVLATAPVGPADGWSYIDSTNNNLYMYYGSDWWCLGTLTVSGGSVGDALLCEDGEQLLCEDGQALLLEA